MAVDAAADSFPVLLDALLDALFASVVALQRQKKGLLDLC